jgi:hypothetical protein
MIEEKVREHYFAEMEENGQSGEAADSEEES